MSKHFSANQFEGAFKSSQLQNWQVPKTKVEHRPKKYEGYSVFISDDRGYLLSNSTRSKESPWGSYVGTWDMPTKIPGNNGLNITARHPSSANSLKKAKEEFEQKLKRNIPNTEAPNNQTSARKNEEDNCSNSTNNAVAVDETVPGSKPQTPKTPRYESPSLNKVTVPTPLGLQDTDIAMRSIRTPSRESVQKQISSRQEGDFKESEQAPKILDAEVPVETVQSSKPPTPKTPLQNLALPSENRVVGYSPCLNQRGIGSAGAQAATISWPGPKSFS